MGHLVLVRHGESYWNRCHRFQGWVDVPLTPDGVKEAQRCAKYLERYTFTTGFTSSLERAHETLLIILAKQNRVGIFHHERDPRYAKWVTFSNHCNGDDIPVFATSILNERFYGALQGMEKNAAEMLYGKEKVFSWRRGYLARPPNGESLKDVEKRVHPYFLKHVEPRVKKGEDVLISGHGNTLRSIIKNLEKVSDDDIAFIDLPEAQPLVYEFKRGRWKRIDGEYAFDRPLR